MCQIQEGEEDERNRRSKGLSHDTADDGEGYGLCAGDDAGVLAFASGIYEWLQTTFF